MPIRFACPKCFVKLSVASRKSGEIVDCPRCRQPVIVPERQALPGIPLDPDPAAPAPKADPSLQVRDWRTEPPPLPNEPAWERDDYAQDDHAQDDPIYSPRHDYSIAGWLAVFDAVLTVPMLVIMICLALLSYDSPSARFAHGVLAVLHMFVWVYLFASLKRLLLREYGTSRLHMNIDLQTVLLVVGTGIVLLAGVSETAAISLAIPLILVIVVWAAAYIVLSIRILLVRRARALKPFAIASLVGGLLAVSIVLFEAAILAGIVADALLAYAFFHASDRGEG